MNKKSAQIVMATIIFSVPLFCAFSNQIYIQAIAFLWGVMGWNWFFVSIIIDKK